MARVAPGLGVEHLRALLLPRPLRDNGGEPDVPSRSTVALAHDGRDLIASFEVASEPPLRLLPDDSEAPAHQEECVELFLASARDPSRYFEIVAGVSGALYTAMVFNPEGSRATWHVTPDVSVPALSVVVSGEPGAAPRSSWQRWSCVMRIPWAGLPLAHGAPAPGERRRGNCFHIGRGSATRYEALSPTLRVAPPDFHVPDRFAVFRF
ncbi:MAG: carbohydrate-binding family 9-like protein [Thermoanaerobaculia bacterium]